MTLQDSDSFITQRGSDLYQVESQELMNKMQDDDLLLVSREQANYKVSWSEVKDDLGGGGGNSIYPNTNDITTTPTVLGSGTEFDPYVLSTSVAAPLGGSAFTAETITIDSQAPNTAVKWTVTSDADGRFNQPEGITDANGDWSGKLQYLDSPVSSVDTTYEGLFQIGLVYFQWTVNQKEVGSIAPVVTNVSLVEAANEIIDGSPYQNATNTATYTGNAVESYAPNGMWVGDTTITVPNFWQFYCIGADGAAGSATFELGQPLDATTFSIKAELGGSKAGTFYYSVGYADGTFSNKVPWVSNANLVVFNPTQPITKIKVETDDYVIPGNRVCSILYLYADGKLIAIKDVGRFTNNSFAASSQVTEGEPLSEKTFDAHVDGTLSKTVKFDEPLVSSNVSGTGVFSGECISVGSNPNPDGSYTDFLYFRTSSLTGVEFLVIGDTLTGANEGNTVQVASAGIYYDQYGQPGDGFKFEYINAVLPTAGGQNYNGTTQTLTNLTFANDADMEGVASGDVVSQTNNFTEPLESTTPALIIPAEQWYLKTTTGNGVRFEYDPSGLFDGNPGVVCRTQDYTYLIWGPDNGENMTGKWGWDVISINMTMTFYELSDNTSSATILSQEDITSDSNGRISKVVNAPAIGLGFPGLTSKSQASAIYCNDVIVVNGQPITIGNTSLNFPASTDMAVLAPGDVVSQGTAGTITAIGTVSSVTGTTVNLSSDTETWVNGEDVTTGDRTTTGTVDGVSGTTATLSSSSSGWANGLNVVGPQKTTVEENTRLYCSFNSDGVITGLQNNPQDPPYTTTATNPAINFQFPATFATGETPDDELPEGTTFTVEVTAENSAGTSGPISATVQPEPEPQPELFRPAYLTGLTTLYTGQGPAQTITNGIDLENNDGLVWIKVRSENYDNALTDTARGAFSILRSNESRPAEPGTDKVTGFKPNGFDLGSSSFVNQANHNYVAWTFGKAAGFFDVQLIDVPNGSATTYNHNLGVKPGLIITKSLNDNGEWYCYHSSLSTQQSLSLDTSSLAFTGQFSMWVEEPTDTTFGYDSNNFGAGQRVVYLFAEDTPDVIKCGGYTGTGNAQFIETGFKPQWILTKTSVSVNGQDDRYTSWRLRDSKRDKNWGRTLRPNLHSSEDADGDFSITDTGFTVPPSSSRSGETYVYVAIAEPEPIPPPQGMLEGLTTLYTGAYNSGAGISVTTGIDLVNNDGLVWIKNRSGDLWHVLTDTVRSAPYSLSSNADDGEYNRTNGLTSFSENGFSLGGSGEANGDGNDMIAWTFPKAAGYFDVVRYTGDGADPRLIPHELGVKPGMVIVKCTSHDEDWIVWHKDIDPLNNFKYLTLNKSTEALGGITAWSNPATFNDQVFSVNNYNSVNAAGKEYVAYLFAEDNPGVIKCGSFTSTTGTDQPDPVNCGFKPQFVLIKCTSDAQNWVIFDNNLPLINSPNTGQVSSSWVVPNLQGAMNTNTMGGDVIFTDSGFTFYGYSQTYMYVAIAAPPDTRSQTNEEFVESQAKFLTYNNRRQVKQGEEALEDREAVIKQAADLGLTKDQINEVFNNG